MSNDSEIAKVRLPQNMVAGDVQTLRDGIDQRVALLLHVGGATKRRHAQDEAPVTLPAGLAQMAKLPDHIGGPWKRFTTSVDALDKVYADRAAAAADEKKVASEKEKEEANRDCDGRWGAIDPWLEGWAGANDDGKTPTPTDAAWLHNALFPAAEGGRKFVSYRPPRQWNAMKPKLTVLASERGQAVINGFGGARLYKQLVDSVARFGRAYGYSAVVADEVDTASSALPEFMAAKDSLRELVRKVESYAEPSVEGSEALANWLLKPYRDLVDSLASSAPQPKKPPPGAPPTPPAITG